MNEESVTPADVPADEVEAKHRLQETEASAGTDAAAAHDPAEDYKVPADAPDPGHHDDTDVPLANVDTADGKGDDEVPAADFESYADSSADKEDSN